MLDRSAHLRKTSDRLLADPDARCVSVWRGRCAVTDDDPPRGRWVLPDGLDLSGPIAFLGIDRAGPRFAVGLPDEARPEGRFIDLLRAGFAMDPAEHALLGYARGMIHFQRSTVHCEGCGASGLEPKDGGFRLRCPACGAVSFARTDPAVMVALTRPGEKLLLARQPGFPPGMFSVLAGFVEPGETLEACVAREVREEVGLDIGPPTYVGSQPWPFPRSLMVGFVAEAGPGAISIDAEELEEVRWFTKDEILNPQGFFIPPPISLAHRLIRGAFDL